MIENLTYYFCNTCLYIYICVISVTVPPIEYNINILKNYTFVRKCDYNHPTAH